MYKRQVDWIKCEIVYYKKKKKSFFDWVSFQPKISSGD